MFWWILASLCAFFVKGLCGFANTLVFTSILSFGSDNITISPVEVLLGYPTNLILAYKERKSIDFKICIPLTVLVILGSLPGIFLLKTADTDMIKILLGIVIICIGIEMLLREKNPKKSKNSRVGLICIGILSGVLCGLYGIGALLGAYISRVTTDSHAFKANICVVFAVENTFRIVVYALSGILTFDIFLRAIGMFPFMLAGLAAGMRSSSLMNEKTVKKLVIVMLILSGFALVIQNL